MPLYGDIAHVKKMLRPTEGTDLGADPEDRLTLIQAAVSLALEEACDMTWGVPAADTAELHWVGPYDQIVLNRPARAITKITYGGEVAGTTMTGGTDVLAADLLYTISDSDGLIYAIQNRSAGVWSWYDRPTVYYQSHTRTPVVVTGDFTDTDDDATVPDDITYAANYLIMQTFKLEKAGVAGFSGLDGSTVPVRNPFEDEIVRRTIRKYARKMVPVV